MIKTNKGFTLIELLVVIAIIGVLASVVLASLSSAREKGNDAKVKSQLAGMRSAAEAYMSTNGNYGAATATNNCTVGVFADTATGMANLVTAANYPGAVAPTCFHNGTASTVITAWSVSAPLSGTGNFWCVDSTGASKAETAATAAAACL